MNQLIYLKKNGKCECISAIVWRQRWSKTLWSQSVWSCNIVELLSRVCAHLRQSVCPAQPLHIPGNANINFFSPLQNVM